MADSPLLDLAEAYYKVARDLEFQGSRQLEMARALNQYADKLCEQNIRETSPPSANGDACQK